MCAHVRAYRICSCFLRPNYSTSSIYIVSDPPLGSVLLFICSLYGVEHFIARLGNLEFSSLCSAILVVLSELLLLSYL